MGLGFAPAWVGTSHGDPVTIVIFGLVLSSSWGNGHATLWRGLIKALVKRGHHVVFFERDVSYYANNRDLHALPGCELVLYDAWADAEQTARHHLRQADVALVSSYCPDAVMAERLVLDTGSALRVFYDLDTPVTLANLDADKRPSYVGSDGFAPYDLVLSYTGGRALDALKERLGARRVMPLYGHVDPDVHRPVTADKRFASALSYLGTYAADRQPTLDALFVEPARRRPDSTFLIGGAQYPQDFPWTANIFFARHVPPGDHPAFFCSGRLTLNVTRQAMAEMGYCPSGRLFEAAACGTAILSDTWPGLDDFFRPGRDILVGQTVDDALDALDLSDAELEAIGRSARERVLAAHTSDHRAADFEAAIASVRSPAPAIAEAS